MTLEHHVATPDIRFTTIKLADNSKDIRGVTVKWVIRTLEMGFSVKISSFEIHSERLF